MQEPEAPEAPRKPSRHPSASYRLCVTENDFKELYAELAAAPLIGFDTETTGLQIHGPDADRIVGFCFSTKPFTGWYLPIRHEIAEGVLDPRQLPEEYVIGNLRGLLAQKALVGFNTKYDFEMCHKEGIYANFEHDVQYEVIMSGGVRTKQGHVVYLRPGQRRLKLVTKLIHGWEQLEINEVIQMDGAAGKDDGGDESEIHFEKYPIDDALDYAAGDADWTLQNHLWCLPVLQQTLNPPKYNQDGSLSYFTVTDSMGWDMPRIYQWEMALMPVVCAMERRGVPIDVEYLTELATICARELAKVEDAACRRIWEACGEEFKININSVPQLRELFLTRLNVQLPNEPGTNSPKKTPKGEFSMDESVLEQLSKQIPWVREIMTYKSMRKLHSSFLSKLPKVAIDGRIHARFNQLGTDTGRFSSSKPNLQQIPKDQHFFVARVRDEEWAGLAEAAGFPAEGFREHVWEQLHAEDVAKPGDVPSWQAPNGQWFSIRATEDGKGTEVWESWVARTRNAIRAKPGNYIIEADYSQIELRVFAGESQERGLIMAFENGEDVHRRTASIVNKCAVEEVTKKQRGDAKAVNFGIIYGATAKRISEQLGIPFREAEVIVREYFTSLPDAKKWIDDRKQEIRDLHYSRTFFYRKRSFEDLLKFNRNSGRGAVEMAEREGVNAIIQGTAADIMKIALVRLNQRLEENFGEKACLVMTVHDSVMIEVSDEIPVADIAAVVRDAMEFKVGDYPPIEIDIQAGTSWGEGEEIKPGETMETPSAELTDAPPVEWVLEILNPVDTQQVNDLKQFLADRRRREATGVLSILWQQVPDVPPHETRIVDETTGEPHRMDLAFADEALLRRILGECRLRQTLDGFDARGVLAGIDDNTIFKG